MLSLLGEYQRRLNQLDKTPSLDTVKDQKKIVELSADSIRLLHAIEPCLPYAMVEFPDLQVFLESCGQAIIRIKKDNAIEGYNCVCKGCSEAKSTNGSSSR